MRQIHANGLNTLALGRQGENMAMQVVFDVSEWETLYGPGAVELLYRRPGDRTPYPVALERDGSTVLWTLTDTDTAFPNSYGSCELRYYADETLAKSRVWRTWVEPGINPAWAVPECPEAAWVEQVLAAGADAKESAERAEAAAVKQPIIQNGTWWVWAVDTGGYVDTGYSSAAEGTGVTDHAQLTGREKANAHPISAIAGLNSELEARVSKGDSITNQDIMDILGG